MSTNPKSLELIRFLAEERGAEDQDDRMPSLQTLSDQLEVSVARLREQLEAAKALGFVEVRPRIGIRKLPYSFFPPVHQSLNYAIALDRTYFEQFSDFRDHVEAAYWMEAVKNLSPEDLDQLDELLQCAWDKLVGQPVRIPHSEHRQLHLALYSRLGNKFVMGILEAYWEAYEAVGLNLYTDYEYLQQVWTYHTKMVQAVRRGDYTEGYQLLIEHKDLLRHRIAMGTEPALPSDS
jgi:DNA-binding FadR family transcriptional regulator